MEEFLTKEELEKYRGQIVNNKEITRIIYKIIIETNGGGGTPFHGVDIKKEGEIIFDGKSNISELNIPTYLFDVICIVNDVVYLKNGQPLTKYGKYSEKEVVLDSSYGGTEYLKIVVK